MPIIVKGKNMVAKKVKRKNEQPDKKLFLLQWIALWVGGQFLAIVIGLAGLLLVFFPIVLEFYFAYSTEFLERTIIPTVLLSIFLAQHITLRKPNTLFKASLLFCFAFIVNIFMMNFSENYEIFLSDGEPLKRILLSSAVI